jgi:hypothetical protein
MKTEKEILIQAKEYAESIGNEDGTSAYDYVMGYNKCQEDMADKMRDLLAWYMVNKGEQYRNETLFVDVVKDYMNSLNK